MPYYPVIYVTSDGKYKAGSLSGDSLDEVKLKAQQRKQAKGYIKVYLNPNETFESSMDALKRARQWLRELKEKWKQQQQTEITQEEGGSFDLSTVRQMLPGMLATLSDQIYDFLRKQNITKIEVIIRTHHIDGSKVDHETDLVLEKEEEEE